MRLEIAVPNHCGSTAGLPQVSAVRRGRVVEMCSKNIKPPFLVFMSSASVSLFQPPYSVARGLC